MSEGRGIDSPAFLSISRATYVVTSTTTSFDGSGNDLGTPAV